MADRQARAAGHDLHFDHDPVQVERELHAYLVTRGQQLARDMDLVNVHDDDLADLGRLDCIAQHPTVSPGLACHLERIAAIRETTVKQAQSTAPDLDLSSSSVMEHHARSGPGPAPKARTTDSPKVRGLVDSDTQDRGRVATSDALSRETSKATKRKGS
jgi:hypothetical protein